MKFKSMQSFKGILAKIMVMVMVVTAIGFAPKAAIAAAKPTLSKSKCSIEVGQTYTLKVNNKIKGSTYKWSSSDKDVATVSKGVVEGICAGKATVTCTVKVAKKTYSLKCKVTVKEAEDSADDMGIEDTVVTDDTKTTTTDVTTDTTTDTTKDTTADTSTTTKADLSKAKVTAIKSIKYDFSVTGVAKATTLSFNNTTTDSWDNIKKDIEVTKDGDYSVTVEFSSLATGLRNIGFIATIKDSPIKVKLNKITINDTYVIDYSAELEVGSDTKNGLFNIWNIAEAGSTFLEGSNSYFKINSEKSAINFYAVQ